MLRAWLQEPGRARELLRRATGPVGRDPRVARVRAQPRLHVSRCALDGALDAWRRGRAVRRSTDPADADAARATRSAARRQASGARTDSPMRSPATSDPTTSARSPSPRTRSPSRARGARQPRCSRLRVSADRPCALVSARLEDVSPTGESLLVSWGLLNLTHRDSHERPAPLEPGREYDVTLQLAGLRAPLRRRAPHPARALADVLAARVALAGARDAARARWRRARWSSRSPRSTAQPTPEFARARDRRRRSRKRPAMAPTRTREVQRRSGDRPPRHPRHAAHVSLAARRRAPRRVRHRHLLDRRGRPALGVGALRARSELRASRARVEHPRRGRDDVRRRELLHHRDVLGERGGRRSCSRRATSTRIPRDFV